MATIKLVQRKDKTRADGTAPLFVRITANRKSRYVSTGIYTEPRYWNADRQEIRKSHPIASALNARLEDLVLKARTEALCAPTASAVKAALEGGAGSLTDYFGRFVRHLEAAGRFWERKKYATTLRKLQACLGQEIDFAALDGDALRRFEHYLRDALGNKPNTIRKEFARLGRVVRQAVKEGIITPDKDPFLYFDKPKGEKPSRRKLTLDEVHALEAARLTPGSWAALARDAFVLAFYAGGMRFGDVCNLRRRNVETTPNDALRLSYRQMKTGTPVSVLLPPTAQAIARRYLSEASPDPDAFVLPFLRGRDVSTPVKLRRAIGSCNALVNKSLKVAARAAGIEPEGLSTHVARHTFADYARSRSGDVYAVSKALGHSSLQITQAYLKSFDQEAVDNLTRQLWDSE